MGLNTLAFRGIHQGTFYAADADCVGLTPKVPCQKNKRWMEKAFPERWKLNEKTEIFDCN
jgi:hypothetical protein